MKIIRDIKIALEIFRANIQIATKPVYFQIIGIVSIVVAYLLFGKNYPYIAWFAVLLPFAGANELVLMWVWDTTITKKGRSLFGKRIDCIIMLGLIPLTWWWFGPTASGMYLIGLLSNHFGEKQTKETICFS